MTGLRSGHVRRRRAYWAQRAIRWKCCNTGERGKDYPTLGLTIVLGRKFWPRLVAKFGMITLPLLLPLFEGITLAPFQQLLFEISL